MITIRASCVVLIAGCTTTLSTMQPADTLVKGEWSAMVGENVIVPVSRIVDAIDAAIDLEETCRTNGCTLTDEQKRSYLDAAIGLALSAPGTTTDFMIRHGLYDRFDAGLRWSTTGVHIDAKYQFLKDPSGWAGSISVGYKHHLFSGALFDVLDLVDIDYGRRDVEIPVIFGRRLGDWGYLWGGPKYVIARYEIDALLKLESVPELQTSDGTIHYFGGFAGFGLGYKRAYAFVELTVMNMYAKPLIIGERRDIGGLIVVPSIGLLLRI